MREQNALGAINLGKVQQEAGPETVRGIKLLQQRVFPGMLGDGSLNRDTKPDFGVTGEDGVRREFGCIARAFTPVYSASVTQDVSAWETATKSGALDVTPALIGMTEDGSKVIALTTNTAPTPDQTVVDIYTVTNNVMDTPAATANTFDISVTGATAFSGRMAISPDSTKAAFFRYGGGNAVFVIIDLSTGGKLGSVTTTINQATVAAEPVWIDDYVYWPENGTGDIIIFGVADSANPTEEATFTTSLSGAKTVIAEGNVLYVVGAGGLVSLDRTSPTALSEVDTVAPSGSYVSMDLYNSVLFMAVRIDNTNIRTLTVDVSGTTLTSNTELSVAVANLVMGGYSTIFSGGYAITWSHFSPGGLNVLKAHVFDVTSPAAVTFVETLSYTHAVGGNLGPVVARTNNKAIATFNFQTESQITTPLEYSVMRQNCTAKLANGGTGASLLTTGPGALVQTALGSSISVETLNVLRGGTGTPIQFTPGSVVFAGTSGIYQQDTDLFWDDTNKALRWRVPVTTLTTADTLDGTHAVVLCDATSGAFAVTLPAGVVGRYYSIKKIDSSSNAITITPDGSETIDGQATLVVPFQYDAPYLVHDGSNWSVI